VTSADGEHLPVRPRNRHDPHRTSYLWALAPRRPHDTLLQPTRPIALRLSPRERLVITAELKCPPWEIGPGTLCATPNHRYGPRSPKACPACRVTTQQT
ncbi:hypothetical protein ACWEWG_40855, partial [Streptomyces sp. NPDC003758]